MDENSLIQSVTTVNSSLIPSGDQSIVDFALGLIKNVCRCVLSSESEETGKELVEALSNHANYDDIKHLILRSLLHLFKEAKNQSDVELSENYVTRAYELLTLVKLNIPGKKGNRKRKAEQNSLQFGSSKDVNVLFKKSDGSSLINQNSLSYGKIADLFASVWFTYLSFRLPAQLHRNILKILDNKIMPHFRNPLSLADFLIESFNIKGSASLLALSSLFILITKCNLEYPDFYKRLYSLITPDVLHVKYRARFFYWTDIFLTSTHIPAYLVAAFIKKLARLALTAPADAILILLPLIGNLLIRHPSLMFLIDKYQNVGIDTDPYDVSQDDFAKSNAMESSLWELRTLLSHWDRRVVEAASFVKKPLPLQEWDLSEILETSFDELKEKTYNSIPKDDFDFHIIQASRQPLKKFLNLELNNETELST